MKQLAIIFSILTFISIGFVLLNRGEVNAGVAVIPMVLAIIFKTLGKK